VYAIDAETGEEIWRFKAEGQILAAAVYSNGKIFFGQKVEQRTSTALTPKMAV